MTAREFLLKLIQELPSHGMDYTDIYICSINQNDDLDSYKIIKISNDGANDAISILIEREK